MKRRLIRGTISLCAIFALVAMTGCSKVDAPPQAEPEPVPGITESVQFEVVELSYDSVSNTVTPPSDDVVYYAFLHPDVDDLDSSSTELIYVDIRYSDHFENSLTSGTQTLAFDGLIGHSHYKIVYFEYDAEMDKKVGDIVFSERITTADAPEEIGLEISDIKGMSANITVTPPTEDTRYFVWVYTMDSYKYYQHSNDYELLRYDYSYWQYAAEMYGIELEEMIEFDTNFGTKTYSTDDFLLVAEWDTEYLVWTYGVTTKGDVTTNITRRTFKTAAPKPSSMTFEVPNIDIKWYEQTTDEGTIRGWRANATIIPSNKEEYYFATITNKDWYDWYFSEYNNGRRDDSYIMTQILYNAQKPSSELPKMFKSGDIEFDCFTEREILLKPDREYAVFVFGMDENGATTGLSVFPFTTDSMPQ